MHQVILSSKFAWCPESYPHAASFTATRFNSLVLDLGLDDWRPYEAGQAAGVEVVNSLAYLVGLYEQKRITAERVLHGLARTTRRGTLRPEWIQSAVKIVSEIRRKGKN
jgi:hypothetical protein